MYQKSEVVAFGKAVGDLVIAVTDGIGADDLATLIATVTSGAQVVNEFESSVPAASAHVVSGISDTLGDWLLTQEGESP